MSVEEGGAYLGLLSFLSFAISVIAAVTAIDMYRLLRSGDAGKPWRVLIISSVLFAFVQVLFIAELLSPRMWMAGLSQVGQLMFALTLAYAFYLQRRLFTEAASLRRHDESRDENRPSRFKRKPVQLMEEASETNVITPTQGQAEAASKTDCTDFAAPENSARSVSAYDSEDDIEWTQVKTASR